MLDVIDAPQLHESRVNVSTNLLTISSSSYLKGVVATIRSFSFLFVFALLLFTIFPAAQIGWPFTSMCGSTGDTGSGQTCNFNDAGETEDDSSQETPEDCVGCRVSVPDCQSTRSHAPMNEISPSTLLVFRLIHPPTAHT